MPFKDTPDGQTHHADDGCIPPHVMNVNTVPKYAERTGDKGKVEKIERLTKLAAIDAVNIAEKVNEIIDYINRHE